MNKTDIQTVLNAIQSICNETENPMETREAIAICEAALAEPSEPVIAYHYQYDTAFNQGVWGVGFNVPKTAIQSFPLYRSIHPESKPAPLPEWELTYATNLAKSIWAKNYKDDAPDWRPLPDLNGVLSQIDNMVCGLVKSAPLPELTDEDILKAIRPLYKSDWVAAQALKVSIDDYRLVLAAAREKQ